MADSPMDLNILLGPQFTIEVIHQTNTAGASVETPFTVEVNEPVEQSLTLEVGVKSSSLFAASGAQSPNVFLTVTSAEALGLYRAITVQGLYCQPTAAGLSSYAGVTSVSVPTLTAVKTIVKGLLTEGSWTWNVNAPIFVGANGVLTQTPGSLPMRRIGWAISATQINFDPYPIIGV